MGHGTSAGRNRVATSVEVTESENQGFERSGDGLGDRFAGFRSALDHDTVAVTLFDGAGRLDYVNPAFLAIFDLESAAAVVGLTAPEMEDLLVAAFCCKDDVLACLMPSDASRLRRQSEQHMITLSNGHCLKVSHFPQAEGGWVTRHAISGGIGSQSQGNDAVISLQALIDQVPDYLWIKDGDSRFLVANRALARDNGRQEAGDLVGLTDFDLHDFAMATEFRSKECEILRTGTAMIDEEEAVFETTGREKWLSSSKIPLRNADGEIIGLIGVARDITARKKAELLKRRAFELEETSRHLAEALEREQRASALQRQFVAMASHEFRTPLAIIDGAAQRLIRRQADPASDFVADKAQTIRQAVNRMVELMESILSFGKLESGTVGIKSEECSLPDVLSACCDRQQDLSKDHLISLDLTGLPQKIMADKSALEQIFTNLLSNAVKYAPGAPKIEVRGWCEGTDVKVAVRDHGIGIDQDDLPKMFERYFRARTSTGIAGTGIGLNLVKSYVDLHGGTIKVESLKGQGSTFTVSLPIAGRG
jgi:PAS domain S-box-containing protein